MRKVLMFALMLVVVTAMAAPAFAFSKGTFRLGARNAFDQMSIGSDTGDIDIDRIDLEGGYFVVDNVELGATYSDYSVDGDGISIIKVQGKYYIPVAENSAFVGGGFADFDFAGANGDALFIMGGYVLQLKTYFSIDFALLLGSGDIEGDNIDITDISVTYSVYF